MTQGRSPAAIRSLINRMSRHNMPGAGPYRYYNTEPVNGENLHSSCRFLLLFLKNKKHPY